MISTIACVGLMSVAPAQPELWVRGALEWSRGPTERGAAWAVTAGVTWRPKAPVFGVGPPGPVPPRCRPTGRGPTRPDGRGAGSNGP